MSTITFDVHRCQSGFPPAPSPSGTKDVTSWVMANDLQVDCTLAKLNRRPRGCKCQWNLVGDDLSSWLLRWARGDVQVGNRPIPWHIAVDASCGFMDRYDVRDPPPADDLMSWCIRQAFHA